MKVIHILHELKFSGAEIMYVDAAEFFQEKGCKLTVLVTAKELGDYAPFFESSGYKVLHNPMPKLKKYFKRIQYYGWFIRLLKKEQFDVVHIHSHATMWGMSFCAWYSNVKSVCTFHSVFPTRFSTYPYHLFIRWCAKRIFKCKFQTISDTVFEHELKLYHNKTIKIYNWYGNKRYFPALEDEKTKMRLDLGIDPNALVLISVGGCNSNKRHSDIIKALSVIKNKIPNCIYLHLGHGETEVDEVQLAKELSINNQIRFYGNQTDVRKYFIASDIYLMTSRFEGISITTIEAMACNVPAILYDVPGLRDFNKEGENSILIPEDYHILAEKVIYMKENLHAGIVIANNAKIFVDEHFNIYNNAEQIYNLYK